MEETLIEKTKMIIGNKNIAIIGVGGLGGNIAEQVARLNPNKIVLFDGDVFSVSNLNRQLFATKKTIGRNKAVVASEHMLEFSDSEILAVPEYLSSKNANYLDGVDIIFDATDNIKTRTYIAELGAKLNIPIIHGAINMMFGQVAIIYPGDKTFEKLYHTGKGMATGETLSFAPALIASIQVATMVKLITNINPLPSGYMYIVDIVSGEVKVISID